MAFDYEFEELEEIVSDLSDYYSETIGRNIDMGVDEDLDIWFSSSRTNGREYVDSIEELERRMKLLYSDLIEDNDDGDDL
jgi:hypothetical protein